jgi:release factor glutamine methyltransferase
LSLLHERPDATGLGTDLSEAALAVARGNAVRHGLTDRADFRCADWFARGSGSFDLIVSNPPYIAEAEMAGLEPEVRDHDPRMALTPGGDGLDAYRAIAAGMVAHLAPGGRLLVEIGPTQASEVSAILQAQGLAAITVLQDLDGRDRVVSGFAPV